MRLLLTSAGFTTPEIIDAFVGLCDEPKEQVSLAIINEAYVVETGDKRWVIKELYRCATLFGGEIDHVNLLALDVDQIVERILKHDALYVVGGHTDYLMYVFERSGLVKALPRILEKVAHVGIGGHIV